MVPKRPSGTRSWLTHSSERSRHQLGSIDLSHEYLVVAKIHDRTGRANPTIPQERITSHKEGVRPEPPDGTGARGPCKQPSSHPSSHRQARPQASPLTSRPEHSGRQDLHWHR